MGIKLPKNQIVENKYTVGKEFMFVSTQREYQGYYYETQGKFYAGKEFQINNPEIIKIKSDKFNNLLGSASTFLYGSLSKVKIKSFTPTSFVYQQYKETNRYSNRYFYSNVNSNPILIKETNEDSFTQIQSDPLYRSITIKWDNTGGNEKTLEEADKVFPGIKLFLQDEDPLDTPF